jgi:predicted phage terminase large subunit-like protein
LPGEAGKDDPLGREEGEALCPERYPIEVLRKMHMVMGDYGYSGLVQQEPIPKGGMMFPRDRVEIIDAVPATAIKRLRYWDKAGSKPEDNGKYTVGVKMSYVPIDENWGSGYIVVEDVARGQWESEVRDREMKRVAQMERYVRQIHEQEPGSGGKQSAEITTKQFGAAGSATEADKVSGDKVIRADPFASQWRAGNVKLLRGEWNKGYLDRMEKSPNGTYLDEMDASAGAFNKIMLGIIPNIRSLS